MRCRLRANSLNLRATVGQFCWMVTGNVVNNSLIHYETDLAAPQYHSRFATRLYRILRSRLVAAFTSVTITGTVDPRPHPCQPDRIGLGLGGPGA